MGVLMQAFYWDAPALENREAGWWDHLCSEIDSLADDGFTALWLPPASKAAEWNSMGYDPYDYFDLGEFNQKGRTETWFGGKQALTDLIATAHGRGLSVYADMVLNHNSGADAQETNLMDQQLRWTKFTPASGKFPRDWTCFHPSSYETMDGFDTFGDMPDLCHRAPAVYTAMMEHSRWLIEEIGFDGFRFDFVKGYGSWLVKGIAEYRYVRGGAALRPFCVGECWSSDRSIDDWLLAVNSFMDNPVSAFDFPLHYQLKSLCDGYGFDLRGLTADRKGTVYIAQHGIITRYDGQTGRSLGEVAYSEGGGFDDVTATPDGGLLCAWYRGSDDLIRFNADGKVSNIIRKAISTEADRSELNTRVAIDGLGNIYALGGFTNAVFKFRSDGKFLNRIGSPGRQPGQISGANAIAVDGKGRVFVSDTKGIQVFDSDGRYLNVFKPEGVASGMVFNDKNELLIVARKTVMKFVLNE